MFALLCLLVAGAYVYLLRAYARRYGRPFGWANVCAFALGAATLAAILSATFDALADKRFAWHMVQHVVIVSAATPLLILGAPHRLLLATLPAGLARGAARVLHSAAVRRAVTPLTGLLLLTALMYAVHFSPLYEAALEHAGVHAFEHGAFLVAALLFWWPLLGIAPAPSAVPHPARLLTIFLMVPASAFLGLAIYTSTQPLYAHYVAALGPVEALPDQRLAGAIMWVFPNAVGFVVSLFLVADWGRMERRLGVLADRRAAAHEAS